MVRTQIQLTEQQHRRLRRWVRARGISLSEAVRRDVTAHLAREASAPSRQHLARAALAVCGKYEDPRGDARVAAKHDRHLASRRFAT
jgi:Arc/MetJ-type ribon-helix-helix transcriptional regulator